MDNKFTIKNEVEEEMGVIEEETSDEDNSSKEGSEGKSKAKKEETKVIKKGKKKEANYETGELSDIKVKNSSTKGITDLKKNMSGGKIIAEKRSKRTSDKAEEEKIPSHKHSSSFHDIRDNYDFIRQHRSSSCKSAADALKFTNKRLTGKRVFTNTLMPHCKRSHHFSSSTSKRHGGMPSLFGMGNRKMSEPSLVDIRKQMECNSKCLSERSWNLNRKNSETKHSVPLKRGTSNSSLSSEYSAKINNTSTTTLTSDFTWEFRSCKLQPLDVRYKSRLIDAEFPFNRRRDRLRPVSRVVDTLPELIECEENLEEEYDLFSNRHSRINIMKDLNEFGRKSKRHRSLDGGRKKKVNNCEWDSDVSETEEEDWVSDDSGNGKGKNQSKISRIFNKIYADHFERPIRMKQIKERNKRNIQTLGDTPINEDSNDSSESSKYADGSDNSSSSMSFRKKYVRAFFDKVDQPETKTFSSSHKYYEQIEDPIQEDDNENDGPNPAGLIRSETYEKFKSRHERWKGLENVVDNRENGLQRKMSFKIRSISFDNEPILEENDEGNELNDPYYHHFKATVQVQNTDDSKSVNKFELGNL